MFFLRRLVLSPPSVTPGATLMILDDLKALSIGAIEKISLSAASRFPPAPALVFSAPAETRILPRASHSHVTGFYCSVQAAHQLG